MRKTLAFFLFFAIFSGIYAQPIWNMEPTTNYRYNENPITGRGGNVGINDKLWLGYLSGLPYLESSWNTIIDSTGRFTRYNGALTNGDVLQIISGVADFAPLEISGGDITGYEPYEIHLADASGNFFSTPSLQFGDVYGYNILYINATNPLIDMRDPANNLAANYSNQNVWLTDGSGAAMDIQYNYIRFVDNDAGAVFIYKIDDDLANTYDIWLPAANGTSGQSWRLNGSLELEWFDPGTVTSFSFTDGSGFNGTVTDATTTPTLSLTTTVSDNQIMVSNSGGISGSAGLTYDNLSDNEHFDATVLEFDIVGTSSYPHSLFNVSDNGNVGICDFTGSSNGTYGIFDDVAETITFSADNGITVNQFAGLGEKLIYSTNSGILTPVSLTDFTLTAGALSITSGAIVNADINSSAAIAHSKMAALTASKALVTDGSGFATTSSTTATEIGYVAGVTSSVQTQLDGKSGIVGTPVHSTGQTGAIGVTTLYTAPADGIYTITVQIAVTTAGVGGSTLGAQIRFTNVADAVAKTMPSSNVNGLNQCAATSTGNAVCYTVSAYCKSGTDIRYITNFGGSGQVYSLDAWVVKN